MKSLIPFAILVILSCTADAQDRAAERDVARYLETIEKLQDQLNKRFQGAIETYVDKSEAARQRTLQRLIRARNAATEATDLATANALQRQIDRLSSLPLAPTFPSVEDIKLLEARNQQLVAALEMERKKNRQGASDVSVDVDETSGKSNGEVVLRGNVAIVARNPIGFTLGSLRKGDTVSFRYLQGKWKGWGRLATESPDEPSPEKGNRCRVAFGYIDQQGQFQKLGIVPAGTATEPFHWTLSDDYYLVVLRINDNDGSFHNNPDTGVQYNVEVRR